MIVVGDSQFLIRPCSSALTPLVFRSLREHICCRCLLSIVERVRSSWRMSLLEEAMAMAAVAVIVAIAVAVAATAAANHKSA